MKFVFLDQDITKDFINGEDIVAPLKKLGEVAYYDDMPCSQDVLYERAKDADVIIFAINHLENSLIERLKRLKLIQFMGIGYRNYVDENFCASRGICVKGVGEYGSNAVAEYTMTLIFALFRGITIADRRMKLCNWDMEGLLGKELAGSTIGLVGTGAIGSLVAKKLTAMGAEVLAFDIRENQELKDVYGVQYTNLESLMAGSDLVSLHLTYTPQTANLISAGILAKIKKGAFFVNTARAQITDYDALGELLKNGIIKGAAIDVHDAEPPTSWSLSKMPNVISTPHIGYYTDTANTNLLRKSVESVLDNI